jgi:hypothetical protein
MPDWVKLVHEQMVSVSSLRDIPPEVVSELAAHLEDEYGAGIEKGFAAAEAEKCALAGIEWDRLAHKIRKAKLDNAESGRRTMNQRTKKLWLPALATITLTAVLLVAFDKVHAGPLTVQLGHLAMMLQLIWFAAMPILGQTKLEEALMNQRTRSIWLPAFVSLTVASLFLFVDELALLNGPSFYFASVYLPPKGVPVSEAPLWFYCTWLLAQVLCGALGASLSRRGGGNTTARIVAGAFPAILAFGLCAVLLPVEVYLAHKVDMLHDPRWIGWLALGLFTWAGLPAGALLLGAALFLQKPPFHAV